MADIKIAGKLVAGASDGVLVGANAVKDTGLGLFQSAINLRALRNGVFNVTALTQMGFDATVDAAGEIPNAFRMLGMVMTYQNTNGEWETKQFTGDDVNDWSDDGSWTDFGGGGSDFVEVTSAQVATMEDPT